MNLSTASRTFQLLSRILDSRTPTEPFLPPAGEKRPLPLRDPQQPLPRATPESQGVSSRHIQRFLEELDRGRDLYPQDVLVLRNGRVLCAAAWGAQDLRAVKYTFSACKSVVSLAVGLLIDDGNLSVTEQVADIFDGEGGLKRRLRGMTVEDLLTMRSGALFTEAEALTETDWVRRFLSSTLKGEPGTEFAYNSLNTYMLSVIVRRRSGMDLTDLLQQRLFKPMGITDVLWERCPMGVEKGGWGLYIRAEDLAKLGQLVMDGGLWRGERLLSRSYLRAALTPRAVPPASTGDFNYGYQIWVGRSENTFLFNGMLGQNVLGFSDSGILVVTHAGADTDFQESRYFEIASRYFGGQFPARLPEDPPARGRRPVRLQPSRRGAGQPGGALPPGLRRPRWRGGLGGPAAGGAAGPPQQLRRRPGLRGGGGEGRRAGAHLPGAGRPLPPARGAGPACRHPAGLPGGRVPDGGPGPVYPR